MHRIGGCLQIVVAQHTREKTRHGLAAFDNGFACYCRICVADRNLELKGLTSGNSSLTRLLRKKGRKAYRRPKSGAVLRRGQLLISVEGCASMNALLVSGYILQPVSLLFYKFDISFSHNDWPSSEPHDLHQIHSPRTPRYMPRLVPASLPCTPNSRHCLRTCPSRNWHPSPLSELRIFCPTSRKREDVWLPIERIDRHTSLACVRYRARDWTADVSDLELGLHERVRYDYVGNVWDELLDMQLVSNTSKLVFWVYADRPSLVHLYFVGKQLQDALTPGSSYPMSCPHCHHSSFSVGKFQISTGVENGYTPLVDNDQEPSGSAIDARMGGNGNVV